MLWGSHTELPPAELPPAEDSADLLVSFAERSLGGPGTPHVVETLNKWILNFRNAQQDSGY